MSIKRTIAGLAVTLLLGPVIAQEPLVPFREPVNGLWGYRRDDGRVVIAARYVGAGSFRDGRAPVKDGKGFATIDDTGQIVERIDIGSVTASGVPIPAPAHDCAWSKAASFPSTGLECYARQLRGTTTVTGGQLTIAPVGGESSHSVVVLKSPSGVVLVEDIRYEGSTRRVLLPGVGYDQALAWRRTLYPDRPTSDGCSESWNVGVIPGGAFIEQTAGC